MTSPTTPDGVRIYIPAHPVAPRRVLAPMQRGNGDPTQRRHGDGSLWRTARTPQGPGSIRFAMTEAGIEAAAWGSGGDWLLDRVPSMLGADDDSSDFEPKHQVIADVWRRVKPMPLPSVGLIFELTVAAILEQKVTGTEARASWRELLMKYGEPAPGPAPEGMRVFPPAAVWRRIPSWEWHRANVMPQRIRTVIAAATVAHRLDEAMAMPKDVRMQRLRAVPGIGAWTAAEVAQRAWGDPDEVSVGDYHVADLVGWALVGRPVDDEEMLALLEVYPGHRHRAVRLIELSPVTKPKFGPRLTPGDIRAI